MVANLKPRPQQLIAMLLSDVDGTLVTKKKELTPRTLEAVRALREAGIQFAITSSRPPAGLTHLIGPLGLTTPLAGFNGGLIVDAESRVLRQVALDPEAAGQTVEFLRTTGVDVWLFHGNEWLVTDLDGTCVAHEQETIRYSPSVVNDFTPYLGGASKIVGSSRDFVRLKDAESKLRELLTDTASIALSQPYYLDITHLHANKGSAVLAHAEMLGISPIQIATIGDMENDVRMFEKSGFAVAMGNASTAVQARANVVTGTNEEDGFARAVENYILPSAP